MRAEREYFGIAERGGFEPPIPFWGILAFQACQLNHSCISPGNGGAIYKLFFNRQPSGT